MNSAQAFANCPEKSTLADFLLGKLPESDIQFVEQHLADCSPCGDTIRLLDSGDTSDDLAQQIKAGINEFESAEEQTNIDAIIRNLQGDVDVAADDSSVAGTGQDRDVVARASEVTQLLGKSENPDHLGRVAHYEVTQLLGCGGTGVVFKAIDTQLQRPVALKILRPSLGKTARERFLSEARTAARIDHEQVITIYHVGQQDDLAYMAMQWLPGETLESCLRRESILPNDDARDIFRQIALGLAAAHENGLIHRDIKPANIWIESGSGRVKILDFGLAQVADDDPQFTETGMIAGTPTFMSPEQSRGATVDHRSDLFSLGCVLYRMISGQLPFQAVNVLATLQSIQRFSPAFPKELNSGVSSELNALSMCLLEKNPNLRPQSAVSVLHALETKPAQWDFAVPEAPEVQQKTKPPTSSGGQRNWITAAVIVTILAGGAWLLGQQIIRIQTATGEIVIETNDPNVDIEVLQDGKLVRLIDTETEQVVEIKAGTYQLRATGIGNSVTIQPNQLVLSRGDKEIVKVTVTSDEKHVASTVGSGEPDLTNLQHNTMAPQFDGKELDHWISLATTERSPTRVGEVLVALESLTNESTVADVFPAFLTALRNSNLERARTSSKSSILGILGKASPQMVFDALLNELENGSEHQLYIVFRIMESARKKTELWQTLAETENIARLLKSFESHDRHEWETVQQLMFYEFCFDLSRKHEASLYLQDQIAVKLPRYWKELPSHSDLNAADYVKLMTIARVLAYAAPTTPDLAIRLGRLLEDGRVRVDRSTIHMVDRAEILDLLLQMGPHAVPALPHLSNFIKENPKNALSVYADDTKFSVTAVKVLGQLGPAAIEAVPAIESLLASTRHQLSLEQTASINKAIQQIKHGVGDEETHQPNVSSTATIETPGQGIDPETPHEPLYDGKPLSYWVDLAKRERSAEKCAEIIGALAGLADESTAKAVIPGTVAILRQRTFFGPREISCILMIYTKIPPQEAASSILNEVIDGNENSRAAMLYVLDAANRDSGLRKAMASNDYRLKLLDAIDDVARSDNDMKRWSNDCYGYAYLIEPKSLNESLRNRIVEKLQHDLEFVTHQSDFAIAAVSALAKAAPETPGLAELIGKQLSLYGGFSSGRGRNQTEELCVPLLDDLGAYAKPAIPHLVDFLGNSHVSIESRLKTIETLGDFGPAATEAVPLLNGLLRNRQCSEAAQEALKKIDPLGTQTPEGKGFVD